MDWNTLLEELEAFIEAYRGTEVAGYAAEKADELRRMIEVGGLNDEEQELEG